MPEGLSPAEVGKEIAEHQKPRRPRRRTPATDRWLSIVEAVLLSAVAVLAAYSGYAAAKWSTESSVKLAKAAAERTKANRADLEAIVTRTLDSASFKPGSRAFTGGNPNAERLAARRMRPGYRPAFKAWRATDPAHNPNAPPGPAYMPQYVIPQETAPRPTTRRRTKRSRRARTRDQRRTSTSATPCSSPPCCSWSGSAAGSGSRSARLGLIGVGGLLLTLAVIELARPPRTARLAPARRAPRRATGTALQWITTGSHRSAASVCTTPRRGVGTLGRAQARFRPTCGSHKSAKITLGRQRYRTAESKNQVLSIVPPGSA